MSEINEEALDKAAREGYAIRCKTNGPRTLAKYASDDIMAKQLADARVIVAAYQAALAVEQESVATVVWYDPRTDMLLYERPHKIIDASLAFIEAAPIGTKLYSAPVAAPVQVKALEWKTYNIDMLKAEMFFGYYVVAASGQAWLNAGAISTPFEIIGKTVEAAKAAAQADYEQRILSTLRASRNARATGQVRRHMEPKP